MPKTSNNVRYSETGEVVGVRLLTVDFSAGTPDGAFFAVYPPEWLLATEVVLVRCRESDYLHLKIGGLLVGPGDWLVLKDGEVVVEQDELEPV